MDQVKRVIANTVAQYIKAIANICMSLYSTRLVLSALNVRDYGIYSIVAGVVGMLGYLTNALATTTQRFLSFYYGKNDMHYVRKIFFNSLALHAGLGLLFLAALLGIEDLLFDHFLNIAPERVLAARYVYRITSVMLVLTVVTAPFKSLLIARENIIYIAIVEICDGVLKLGLALILLVVPYDKLIFYTIGMFIVLLINFCCYIVYCLIKYEECRVFSFHSHLFDKQCLWDIMGFAGWTTFGMLAGVCQTQGSALVLNKFFGTVMNAAYGIAMQVNNAVRFVSTSVINAMNPQIMKAEGNGDRDKMLRLSEKESKFSAALMIILSVPVIAEMPTLLDIWLTEVPEHTVMFTRALMVAFILDQTTLGLHAANQSTGHIRVYTICTTVPKILIVPVMWVVLKVGWSVTVAMWYYVGIEGLVACFRIPYMKYQVGLKMLQYLKAVFFPIIPLVLITSLTSFALEEVLDFNWDVLVSLPLAFIVGILSFWIFTLNKEEREYSLNLIKSKLHHANKVE
ncbi:MAG: lipopolysaccharide biosynthesis protein [Prevotella sp.]|jgi:O-antigen/teichoic acid export membrane protein